nr:zinc ABC transporter substrate-binding protein [Saprospiraceae bacterium]
MTCKIYCLWTFFLFLPYLLFCNENKPLVIATNTILADIAFQLAGDEARVVSLVPLGMDPHNFDPSPADIKLTASADLILTNGLNLESWLLSLIKRTGYSIPTDTVTLGIQPILTGKYESVVDPHAWLDPLLGIMYVKNTERSLSNLLPHYRETIEFNSRVMQEELLNIHNYTIEKLNDIPPEQRILITSHDAFRYFGQRYGLVVKSVFPSSPDAEITVKDMAALSQVIQQSGVKAIFPESTINPRIVNQIASDNQLILGGKLYSDSLSEPGKGAPDYISMLYHNANQIYNGLTGKRTAVTNSSLAHGDNNTNLYLTLFVALVLLGSFVLMWYKLNFTPAVLPKD